jgi:hypothetical protein
MPAQFTVKAADLKVLLAELKNVDPGLRKALQKEMRDDLKPIVTGLAGKIPKQSPLSGFGANAQAGTAYRWGAVGGSVITPLGKRAKRRGFYPVVSMKFRTRGSGKAGFEILELAGSVNKGKDRKGMTYRGNNLVQGLKTAGYEVKGGLGRFLIPEAKGDADKVTRIAIRIIEKYVALVNRRIS